MQKDQFDTPIIVKVDAAGTLLTLKTARDTSEFLLNQWPGKRTEKHRAAIQACSDVVNAGKPPMGARRAFVAAAREAGVFVDPKTMPASS
ncbi:DUF982 domain-containing protein [Georhizobium profundi]|jgi:hypothetical protein|uniref:DUF982 domain-containing protein n=1 Tax=Georhizobium profundi TaxID=2341112 RepID=A0A3Q8XQI2_9HYPH|nr:DUF982 domain-containing protein [Georhizobium profundi]AZN73002.1 DUF982 domain-containing protein [Georhizobium profundi]GLQ38283.1 hypothetical protein GCM10007908_19030 [Rhizobium albus]